MISDNPENNQPKIPGPDEGYGIFELVWLGFKGIPDLLRSLKFAVWMIVIISVLSLMGAILPQEKFNPDKVKFAQQYAQIFHIDSKDNVTTFGEVLYKDLVVPLELYRIFQTPLFFILTIVLTISATLCAWDRIFLAIRIYKGLNPLSSRDFILKMPDSGERTVAVSLDEASKVTGEFLRGKKFKAFEKTGSDGRIWWFAHKNPLRYFASVAFHFAFVFILIGVVVGDDRVAGYDGIMAIGEGSSRPLGSELYLADKAKQEGKTYEPKTDEQIRLVNYENVYREKDFPSIDPETGFPPDYDGSPSDYISHVEVVSTDPAGNESTILTKAVEVNKPLEYRGVSYFQSSVDALLNLTIRVPDESDVKIETFLGEPFNISSFDLVCEVKRSDFIGGVFEKKNGEKEDIPYTVRLVDYVDFENPEIIGYLSTDKPLSIQGVTFTLDKVTEYTVFKYRHDPGVPIVYFGGLLLIVALTFAMYFPYATVRVSLKSEGKGTSFTAGGNINGLTDLLEKALTASGKSEE